MASFEELNKGVDCSSSRLSISQYTHTSQPAWAAAAERRAQLLMFWLHPVSHQGSSQPELHVLMRRPSSHHTGSRSGSSQHAQTNQREKDGGMIPATWPPGTCLGRLRSLGITYHWELHAERYVHHFPSCCRILFHICYIITCYLHCYIIMLPLFVLWNVCLMMQTCVAFVCVASV